MKYEMYMQNAEVYIYIFFPSEKAILSIFSDRKFIGLFVRKFIELFQTVKKLFVTIVVGDNNNLS